MATIDDILKKGGLVLYQLPEWDSRLPINPLYYPPSFEKWVKQTTELTEKKVGSRTLMEHLDQTLSDFRCSERPAAGDLRRMMPSKHGIWKLHPPGLRIYGFAPAPCTFVTVTGALEAETKTDKKLNDKKRDEVREFLKVNDLSDAVVMGDILAIFPIQTK